MSRTGNLYHNAAMASFNATYKRECVGLTEAVGGYATRAEAAQDFFDYVEKYYNRRGVSPRILVYWHIYFSMTVMVSSFVRACFIFQAAATPSLREPRPALL